MAVSTRPKTGSAPTVCHGKVFVLIQQASTPNATAHRPMCSSRRVSLPRMGSANQHQTSAAAPMNNSGPKLLWSFCQPSSSEILGPQL